jgi:hypothetical protein
VPAFSMEDSSEPMQAKVQQVPYSPWSFTGVSMPVASRLK